MKELIHIRERLDKSIQEIDALIAKTSPSAPATHRLAINAGHAGRDPKTGKYLTKGKQFAFDKTEIETLSIPTLHEETIAHKIFYEGVWNRDIAKLVMQHWDQAGIPYVQIHHDYKEMHVVHRAELVNKLHKEIPICLLMDLHSNSSKNGKARGFEVFTSPGETKSDYYATMLWEGVKEEFPSITMRQDTSDGDVDREKNFVMVTKTWPPAFTAEFLFFDNIKDIKLIINPAIMRRYAKVLAKIGELAYNQYQS